MTQRINRGDNGVICVEVLRFPGRLGSRMIDDTVASVVRSIFFMALIGFLLRPLHLVVASAFPGVGCLVEILNVLFVQCPAEKRELREGALQRGKEVAAGPEKEVL